MQITLAGRPFARALLMVTLVAGVTAAGCSDEAGRSPAASAGQVEAHYQQLVRTVLPSVVQIRTADGLGSGVVFDGNGNIVTNAHVVGDATDLEVLRSTGGAPLRATVVGSYPPNDVAVIRVANAAALTPAKFGDSSELQVGQLVLAMGNPLGFSGSVTSGVISGLGRTISEPGTGGGPAIVIGDAVQASAAINSGNSGGALVDMSGHVVGIPTLAAVDPQLGAPANGLGFSIPSDTATDLARRLITNGKVTNTRRASLSISALSAIAPDGRPAGIGVAEVTSGGAAAKAGIQPGDTITAVAGKPTPTTTALAEVLAQLQPGATTKVDITHANGTKTTLTVTLDELPGS